MKNTTYKKLQTVYFYLTVVATGFMTGMKIAGTIALSWWWITAPIWGSFIIAMACVLFAHFYLRRHDPKTDD